MSNTEVQQPKVQRNQVEKSLKKRHKKSKNVDPLQNGQSEPSKLKEKKLKVKNDNNLIITDLLAKVPQLHFKELGGGEGLGHGVIIYKKQLFIPRQSKIQIYHSVTSQLITTLTPTLSTELTSILKIQLSPNDQTLYCLTSDGHIHSWQHPYNKYLGSIHIHKTVLDFLFTETNSNLQLNLLIRDDTYENPSLLKFKSKELESKWMHYFSQNESENEFPTYVVNYDSSAPNDEVTVGTPITSHDDYLKKDRINDIPFLQSLSKEVGDWHLNKIVRIPRNCVLFNELPGFPSVLFSFVDDIIVLIDPSKSTYVTYKHSRPITAIALHPTLPQFVYADTWGKILLNQFSVDNDELKIFSPNCTLHWHSQAVTSLCYLSSGIHLLSGGKESVMVQWNLVEGTTRLLPRLSNSIESICPYGSKSAAIRCDDGSVTVVHDVPDFQRLTTFKGIDSPSDTPPVVNFNPRTNEIAMISQNDQVTFFHPDTCQVTDTLHTTNLNKFQQTNAKQQITDPRITHLAFSKDGDWLVTSEFWNPIGFPSQSTLKFWHFDTISNTHKLITHIVEPHQGSIISLKFAHHSKVGPIVLSLGQDNVIHTWTLTNNDNSELSWSCTVTHRHPKANILIDLDISSDGTLCSLTSNSKLILWDPLTNSTLTYLSPNLLSPQIQRSYFVPNTPYLVLHTLTHLTLIHLIDKTQLWSLELKPLRVFIDPIYSFIHCLVSNNNDSVRLLTLDPKFQKVSNHCLIPIKNDILPEYVLDYSRSIQLHSGIKLSQVYFVDGSRTVFGLTSIKSNSKIGNMIVPATPTNDDFKELNTNEIPSLSNSKTSKKRTASGGVKSSNYLPNLEPFFEILSAPGHMLPPSKQLFMRLVQMVLPPKVNDIEDLTQVDDLTSKEDDNQVDTVKPIHDITIFNNHLKALNQISSITPTIDELDYYLTNSSGQSGQTKDIKTKAQEIVQNGTPSKSTAPSTKKSKH